MYHLLCEVEFLYCSQAYQIEPNTLDKAITM